MDVAGNINKLMETKMSEMKKVIIVFILTLTGCSSSYIVKYSEQDPFAKEKDNTQLIQLKENYIIAPNIFGDASFAISKPQLNAYLFVDNAKKSIIEFGLIIMYSNILRNIRILEGNSAILLTDKSRIELFASSPSHDYYVNAYEGRLYESYIDMAYYSCTKEQFEEIVNSNTLSIKVNGSDGSNEILDKYFIKSCKDNIKQFYYSEIKPRQ